jgi:hypothetical protein
MVDPFCRKEGVRSNRTPESTAYPRMKVQRDRSMPSKRSKLEGAEGLAPQDSRDTTKAGLLETQFPVAIGTPLDHSASTAGPSRYALPIMRVANAPLDGRWGTTSLKGTNGPSTSRSTRQPCANAGSPTGRESYGDGAPVVVAGVTTGCGGRESRPQGEGAARESEPELMLGMHEQGRCF